MREIVWTTNALRHLEAIHAYIGLDSPVYAQGMVGRIVARVAQVGLFPRAGRRVPECPEESVREVIENPYRIVYEVTGDGILVLAVIHCCRRRRQA